MYNSIRTVYNIKMNTSNETLVIDPPSGWRYGFPRPAPAAGVDINTWLVEHGYPQALVDEFGGKPVPCRYWVARD